jgi:hypothetical protein
MSEPVSIFATCAYKLISLLVHQMNQQREAQARQAELQLMAQFRAEELQAEHTRNVIELVATAGGMVALGARLYDLAASAGRARAALEREVWLENLRAANDRGLLRLAYDLERETRAWGATVDSYPFQRGPGKLRRKLELQGGTGAPVVLLPALRTDVPPHPWAGLPAMIRAELAPYEGRFLHIELADRHFEWPDPDLIRHDLDGIPVVVLDPVPLGGTLEFRIGGAHIFPQSMLHVLPMAGTGTYSPEDPVSGVAPGLGAARAAAFRIMRAVDCVHLMRSRGHSELTDDAAARYGAGQRWPADHGLPLSLVADPAHHLLHRAVRLLRRGDVPGADLALAEALTCLGGVSDAGRPPWPALITAAGRSGQMEHHHLSKLLDLLHERFPGEGLEQHLRDPRLAQEPTPGSLVPARPGAAARDSWVPRGHPPLL